MTVARTAMKRQGPESPEGFFVSTQGPIVWASPTMLQPTTRQFVQWTLTSGGQIVRNGQLRSETSGVADLVYHNHTLFQVTSMPQWWYWNTTTSDGTPGVAGWVFFNLLGPINLSTTTYPAGAVAGTTIATVSVPMSTNAAGDTFPGAFGGTLTIGGPDAASFAISGTTLSVAPGQTLTNTQYNITISAQVPVGSFNVGNQILATAFQLTQVAQAESVEGFSVTTVGPTVFASLTNLVASSGPFNQFALNASGAITLNGVAQTGTSAIALVYHDHTQFHENSTPRWFYWNTSTSDATPGSPGYVVFNLLGPISLNTLNYNVGATAGTTVATVSVPMTSNAAADTFPGPWGGTLTLAGADAANFVISGSNLNVAAGRTLTNNSYSITISAQVPVGTFLVGTQLGPTAFALTAANVISGITLSNATFTEGVNNATVGTIGVTMSAGTFTGSLSLTGTNAASFRIVGSALQTNGTINTAGPFSLNIVATQAGAGGSPFTQAESITGTTAAVSITGVTLSNSSFTGGAPNGTVVGTIGVTMSSGSFTGSLSLTGTNASSFQIVGTSLETSGVVASGTYSINIVATQAGAGGSPFTQPESITTVQNYTLTPFSSLALTTGAVSPLGWPVDFFDDFNGTFTRGDLPNWFHQAGSTGTNGFTTGAMYNGSLATYGAFFNGQHWGGYAIGSMDMNNITMAGSNLVMTCTNVSGTGHWASCLLSFPSIWGLWEASMAGAPGANGATSNINMGFWTEANVQNWPVSGEIDVEETALINGISTTIHMGTSVNNDNRKTSVTNNHALPSGTWHDGVFHIYSCLITPAYVATYVDGTLIASNNSANILSNLSTTSDPPTASAAGSIGFNLAASHGSPISLTGGDGNYNVVIFGIIQLTFTAAELPVSCQMDWFRHSKLTPASGGPHA